MFQYRRFFVILLMVLTTCTTNVETNPSRTATEELLLSTASERAAKKLSLAIPANAKVFIDNSNFEGTDSKYAIAAIRSHLLQRGIILADDKKQADVIIETRAGALSTDRKSFLIGIPQFSIPIPLAPVPITFPEIALYGTEEQKSVAKFAVTGYNAKEGTLVDAQDPQYGFSYNTKKTVLIFISWTESDYLPETTQGKAAGIDPAKKAKPHLEINGNGYAPDAGSTVPAASAR